LLYPNKKLPGFLKKNTIPKSEVTKSTLLTTLIKNGNTTIVEQDITGGYHFNGNFKNASDLRKAIEELESNRYPVTTSEKEEVLTIFEKIFNQSSRTFNTASTPWPLSRRTPAGWRGRRLPPTRPFLRLWAALSRSSRPASLHTRSRYCPRSHWLGWTGSAYDSET
jgi:hypothetical protein